MLQMRLWQKLWHARGRSGLLVNWVSNILRLKEILLHFSHLWREQNEAAHSKAMEGRRLAVDSYWIEEAPEMVEKVVEKDMV